MLYILFFIICFFFFKQKTAYEMRISDWSSDVCSSDLTGAIKPVAVLRELLPAFHEPISAQMGIGAHAGLLRHRLDHRPAAARRRLAEQCRIALHRRCEVARGSRPRSEEHTSELQSLMRLSYAVFCLKKKNKQIPISNTNTLKYILHTLIN